MDSYEIVSSGKLRIEFQQLCARASAEGRLPAAAKAAKETIAKMQSNPNELGELLYHLKHTKMPVRHVVNPPWSFHVTIDEERRRVYLKSIALLDAKK